MLFVLFQLGPDRYALEASRVVEVVPLLALKRFPQSPRGMAGMFVYRGRPVPALDLCELTTGRPALDRLSTRIIIINHSDTPGTEQLLGLIAERATETLRREAKDFVDSGVQLASTPFLGPVLMDGQGVIQLIHAGNLLTANVRELLFANPVEVNDAPH
jgi:chemotaxis-related protein WspB